MLLATILAIVSAVAFQAGGASARDGFRVSGTTILDATGTPFVMRGINYPHSWYKTDAASAVPAMAKTGANVVRIVLSDGQQYYRDDQNSVQWLLELCKQQKLVAILEVHDATGSDDVQALERAADYWIGMAGVLKGLEDRVIINVANEWHGSSGQAAAWASAYKAVLRRLRNAGLRHLIVVDAPGWGQDASAIAQQGRAVFQADPLHNTVFSIHMYEVAASDRATVQRNIDNSLAIGVPLIIGEFATAQNGKAVAFEAIMDYCQTRAVGWLAWSWFGNNADTKHMDMVNGPTGTLTAWGRLIVGGKHGFDKESRRPQIWSGPDQD